VENKISIVLCTYNGRNKLSSTLSSLSNLVLDNITSIELIVVDNLSNDHTTEFVDSYWNSELNKPYPLVLLNENRPGKLFAQELAFKHAKGEFILICDDDNELNADYLQIGLNYLIKNTKIGVIGGQGIAISTSEIPEWFESNKYHFACAPQAPKTGNVMPTRNVVYGAGMWVRKSAYDKAKKLGFKFLLNSRTGSSLTTGGEDSELCWAIKLLGYEIWYVEELRFKHHIPSNRLTNEYRNKLLAGMIDNAPLAGAYLRIWKNNITQQVRFFWVKELLYAFKAYLLNRDNEYKKILKLNIRFYFQFRSKYDDSFNQIINYRNRCLEFLNNTHK